MDNNIQYLTDSASIDKKNKLKIKIDFNILMSLLATILVCIAGNSRNTLFSVFIILIYSLLIFKPENFIGPIIFLTAFDNYLVAFPNGDSFSRYCVLLFIISSLIKNNFRIRLTKNKFMIVFPIMLAFLSAINSRWGILGYTSFPGTFILNILFYISLLNLKLQNKENLINNIVFYSILALFFYLYIYIDQRSILFSMSNRSAMIGDLNANDFAIGLGSITCFIYSYIYYKEFKKFGLYLFFIILSIVLILISGSRTSAIALVAMFFAINIMYSSNEKKTSIKKMFIGILVIFIISILYNYLQKIFPDIMKRFTIESVLETGGTSRLDIWNTYFTKIFPRYWLFGIGFDQRNFYYAIEYYFGIGHGAHNILVEILETFGVLGLIMFAYLFVKPIIIFKKNIKNNILILFPFSLIVFRLISGIGENVIQSRFIWIGLGLFINFLGINKSQESIRR